MQDTPQTPQIAQQSPQMEMDIVPVQDMRDATHVLIPISLLNSLAGYFRKTAMPHEQSDPFIQELSAAHLLKLVPTAKQTKE